MPGAPVAIVGLGEEPADQRLHAQRRKEIGGDRGAFDPLRLADADQVAGGAVVQADALEDRAALLPVAIVRRRELQLRVAGVFSYSLTSRSGSGNGSGRSSTKSVTENAAVVAPMPSATMSTAVIANPGARRSMRAV